MNLRKRQPLQAVMSQSTDPRLDTILQFGEMCLKMAGRQGKRDKQLSRDTAACIHQTCCGLVDLTRHLLEEEGYKYVCLGEFSTDPLEKAFSKLRQGSGGSYFINAQQVSEKIRIQKAKLQISLNSELADSSNPSSHQCDKCEYSLSHAESDLFDQLPSLESSLSAEAQSNIVHIAGYVSRKISAEGQEDTYRYYEKYGQFTAVLSRGGLTVPGDKVVQWTAFSYLLFDHIKDKVCRISLSKIFNHISDFYEFEINHSQIRMLANTFLSSFCKSSTPLQRKETMQKIIKLS